MKKYFILGILLLVFVSCDSVIKGKGRIIDETTLSPISNAKISIKDLDTIYSDSIGQFAFYRPVYGAWAECELLIEKDGYKTKYIKPKPNQDNIEIKLESSNETIYPYFPKKAVKMSYYANLIIFFINLFTLIFIYKKKVKGPHIWLVLIILFNLTLYYLYLDGSLIKISILNGPVYLSHYWLNPFSIKIVIPIVTITFWIIYFLRPDLIKKRE